MGLLKIFFLIVLTLFPLGELLRADVTHQLGIKPLDVMVVITSGYWVIWKLWRRKKNKAFYYLLPLSLFSIIGLFSLFLFSFQLQPQQFLISVLYLVRWISYALLLPIVLGFDADFKSTITKFLLIDGAIIMVLGYFQFWFYPYLYVLHYQGWDEHMYRVFSTFLDPNYTGAFFVLYLLFVSGVFYRRLKEKKNNYRLFFISLLTVTLYAIMIAFSKTALIMLVIGIGVFAWLIGRKKILLILLSFMVIFFILFSSRSYIENVNLLRIKSFSSRLDSYSSALTIFSHKPLFGVGFNSYRYAKSHYGMETEWTGLPSHADAGVDNSWLLVLATTGIVGFIAYVFIWFRVLKRAHELRKTKEPFFPIIVISSSVALFVGSLFTNALFFAPLMLWMWVLIGVMEKK